MSFFISDAVATAAPVAQQSGIEGVLFPLSIILLFYFIFRRLRSKRAKKTSNNKFSNIVITGGVIGIIFGLFMDTTVSSGNIVVNNIGLMNMQQNILMVSSVAVIVGFIMSIKNKNKVVDTSEFKACPYCAESIKKEAILCRYCGKDV